MCLEFFASPAIERHSKPEVEVQKIQEALLPPVKITKSANEDILIESSINSVRISLKIKQVDELEELLCHKFSGFLMQRAENFSILRRKAIQVSP